jgi:hypothetical protein
LPQKLHLSWPFSSPNLNKRFLSSSVVDYCFEGLSRDCRLITESQMP